MSRQSATRARCSDRPFFSSEIPAFFTRLTICGGGAGELLFEPHRLVHVDGAAGRCGGAAAAARGGSGGGAAAAVRPPRGRLVVDADAVVGREPGKPGAPALADGAELPRALPAVDLTEDEGGLGRGIGDVEAHQFGAGGVIDRQVQAGRLPDRRAVGRRRDRDRLDLGGQRRRD